MSYRQKLTDLGRDVIAKGQTGQTITFTRIQLGEGAIADPNSIDGMTALVAPVMDSPIVGVARTALGQATITTKIPLGSIARDFHLTEIGVWATVGSDPEVLYGVSYSIGIPDVISQEMGGGATAEHTISIAILIGTTENVTAILYPDMEIVNIGQGASWFSDRVGNQFRFRRAFAGEGVEIIEEATQVRFISSANPIGVMAPYAGRTAPHGWLICDGTLYLTSQYPALASVLGNTYGGDGVTDFAVPDCRDRSLIGVSSTKALGSTGGAATHTLSVQELAGHNHTTIDNGHNHGGAVHDWGHSHGVFDAVHGHGTAAHGHSGSVSGGGSAPEGMAWGTGITYSPGGTGMKGLIWMPRTYGLGNSPDSTRVEYNPWLAWANAVSLSVNAAVVIVNNAWANISATHGNFTGVQVPWGTTGLQVNSNGSSQPHNNMPPYLTIQWIIRT